MISPQQRRGECEGRWRAAPRARTEVKERKDGQPGDDNGENAELLHHSSRDVATGGHRRCRRRCDPYDSVLADLRAKRDQIDQTIAAIEAIRGGNNGAGSNAQAGGSNGGAAKPANGNMEGPGALLGMSIVDAAKALLASKRTPLKNPDFAALFKAGGLHMNSKEPANTIGSVLSRRQMEHGDVVKVGRGTWGLKEWYPNRSFKKEAKDMGKPDDDEIAAANQRSHDGQAK